MISSANMAHNEGSSDFNQATSKNCHKMTLSMKIHEKRLAKETSPLLNLPTT
jgi:hypothetical protein